MESNHDPVPALLVLRNFGVQGAEAAQRELRPTGPGVDRIGRDELRLVLHWRKG